MIYVKVLPYFLIFYFALLPDPGIFAKNYYISTKGDDSFDGLSENRPLRSLEKLMTIAFEKGDTILFERGHTWYGSIRLTHSLSGVHLTSFGKGGKPEIKNTIRPLTNFENTNCPGFSLKPVAVNPVEGNLNRYWYNMPCNISSGYLFNFKAMGNCEITTNIAYRIVRKTSEIDGLWTFSLRFNADRHQIDRLNFSIKCTDPQFNGLLKVIPLALQDANHMVRIDLAFMGRCTELLNGNTRLNKVDLFGQLDSSSFLCKDGIMYTPVKGNKQNLEILQPHKNAILVEDVEDITLENLHIVGGFGVTADSGVVALKKAKNITINNCTIESSNYSAVSATDSNVITIKKSILRGGGVGGIYLHRTSKVVVSQCKIEGNGACAQDKNDLHAIGISDSSNNNIIEYNLIQNNGFGNGSNNRGTSAVTVYNSSGNTIQYNLIENNWRGAVNIDSGQTGETIHNIVAHNLLRKNGLIGEKNLTPVISVYAHDQSVCRENYIIGNVLRDNHPGTIWSLATQDAMNQTIDKVFINQQPYEVISWIGKDLRISGKAIIQPGNEIKNSDHISLTRILRINMAPSVVSYMSPLKPTFKNVFAENILVSDAARLIFSIDNKTELSPWKNYFCVKGKLKNIFIETPLIRPQLTHNFFKKNFFRCNYQLPSWYNQVSELSSL